MTSRERVSSALSHRQPDGVPLDLGSSNITGMHVSVVAALREYFGLEKKPVKVIEPGQMLGEVERDLADVLGVDVQGVFRRMTRWGVPAEDWKPWRMDDGLEVLVPGGFTVTKDSSGDTLVYPQGDLQAQPSGRMPAGGYFFDTIVRQAPFDEDTLDPKDNLEEFGPVSDAELAHLVASSKAARATGRAVIANAGGTSFGDIANVPGPALKHPKGIRDITEWYVSTRTRRGFVRDIFEGQCEIGLANLEKIAARVGDSVDVMIVCGTDFGTQSSSFCSVATFRELWMPYYRRVNDWIHAHTSWKTFKHSCGAVEKFIGPFLESGFDILNPVQCSASGMEPELLKSRYGHRLVFWGGGVDTQAVLPFGTPEEVREQVLRRCEIFAPGGGFVFNTVHNVQARTPVPNIIAMWNAVREFNGVARL